VKPIHFLSLLAGCMALLPNAAQADWQAIENVQPYSVAGKTAQNYTPRSAKGGPRLEIPAAPSPLPISS
jgi:predicted secreted Zn-dependent protease